MLILIGKSGSGKDTLGKLLEADGYEKIRTYTTRPKRQNETDEYHFVSQEEFDNLRASGFFGESRDYNAAFGHCSYGSALRDYQLSGKYYIILTPSGFNEIQKKIPGVTGIFLDVSVKEREARLLRRAMEEENPEKAQTLIREISRRIAADEKDFMELTPGKSLITIPVMDNESVADVYEKLQTVIQNLEAEEIQLEAE